MGNNSFNYKYSAPTEGERREIESIRRQYDAGGRESGKLARLKGLHRSVKRDAALAAVMLGVVGTLIFGAGFSLVLEFGEIMTGVIISLPGIAMAAAAYPVYKAVLKSKKKKYAEEIIRLSDELLG